VREDATVRRNPRDAFALTDDDRVLPWAPMRAKTGRFALAALMLGLLGCATPRHPLHSAVPNSTIGADSHQTSNVDFEGQFLLSPKDPEHPLARVRLISVGYQGGTVIQHLDTQRHIHAAPGEFFVCEEFGTNRLKLLWGSQREQKASFIHKWTEQRYSR
jgi:hypothetical protein